MTKSSRMCKPTVSEANRQIAIERFRGLNRFFGPVYVLICEGATSPNKINFIAIDTAGNEVTVKDVPWGDERIMWAPCPSTLPSMATPDDHGGLPEIDANGYLYLTTDFANAHNLQFFDTPKWPIQFSQDFLAHSDASIAANANLAGSAEALNNTLPIFPTKLILTGRDLSSPTSRTRQVSINLLDQSFAPKHQVIDLGRRPMNVQFTQRGLSEFIRNLNPFESLLEAVKIINAEPRADPLNLARAWSIVASCTSLLEENPKGFLGDRRDDVLKEIGKVLPDWKAGPG